MQDGFTQEGAKLIDFDNDPSTDLLRLRHFQTFNTGIACRNPGRWFNVAVSVN